MKPITTILPIETLKEQLLPSAKMPFAFELEQAVLGLIMIENSGDTEQAMLLLSGDSFYDGCHKTIFEAMRKVEANGKKIDLYTVAEQLKVDKNLGAVAGAAYLAELTQKVASGAHFGQHVRYLLQCQAGRALAAASYRALCRALDEVDVVDVMDNIQSDLDAIATIGLADTTRCHISTITEQMMDRAHIRAQKATQGVVNGVPTGLAELDKLTSGWQGGQLIVLAARPAMGKTAFMLHLATTAAAAGVPVIIYSVEMSAPSLVDRMTVAQCQVSPENFKSGRLSTSEFSELAIAKTKMDAMPIYIDDKSGVSIRYIATHSKIMRRQGKCGLILIDYLQLLDMRSDEKGRNREQDVAQCSKAAKELARELNVPVILLAQLSRASETRGGNKEPMLSDLRESGAIEQDADIVLFPHRPQYYTDKPYADVMLPGGRIVHDMPLAGLGKLIVAKQRDGATGAVMFSCNNSLSRFWDFDETPYLTSAYGAGYSRGSCVGDRPVSSGSINYVAPAAAPTDDLPF